MKLFKEYYLDMLSVGTQTLYLPINADVVAAKAKFTNVVLTVLQDQNEQNTSLRKFKICKSCENIYENIVKYIDTVYTDYGDIHIVEVA